MKFATFCLVCLFPVMAHGSPEAMTLKSLTSSGFGGGRQPQVAVSPDGTINVVFGKDTALYVTTSTDHGETFSAPVKIADVPKLNLGMRRGPRVAATADRILVTAPGSELESFVSMDKGSSWSKIGPVNDRSRAAEEGLQNITALPDGSFYAVWLDDRTGLKQIEGARLEPNSTTWSPNVNVYQSPEQKVCECCHPTVVSDSKGKLTVMWRNNLAGNRDFYLSESSDRGDTFSTATKLGDGSWKLNACPMDGGNMIATSDAGVWTIWRRQNDIFLDQPGKPEVKIGDGAQPVLARIAGDLFCAWQQGGNLIVARDSGRTQAGTFPGGEPSLVASPDGKEGYLVWEGSEGGDTVPKFAVLR